MAKKLTLLEFVNALLPAGAQLRIADTRPTFQKKERAVEVVRRLRTQPEGWPAVRPRLRALAKQAMGESGKKQARTLARIAKLQRSILGKAAYPVPADRRLRLEIVGPQGPLCDQYGVLYTKKPPRSQFSYTADPDRSKGGRTRMIITTAIAAKVNDLHSRGSGTRKIEKYLREQGMTISRTTIRNRIPRPQ